MGFMSKLRKNSPTAMACGGIGLMATGTVLLLSGAPPVPGLGPLEMIGAGWAGLMGSFAVPADAVRNDTEGNSPNKLPLDIDIAHRWIEVIDFSVVAICAGGLSIAAYLTGDKAFAIILVGIVFYVGFNRFFYWASDVFPPKRKH